MRIFCFIFAACMGSACAPTPPSGTTHKALSDLQGDWETTDLGCGKSPTNQPVSSTGGSLQVLGSQGKMILKGKNCEALVEFNIKGAGPGQVIFKSAKVRKNSCSRQSLKFYGELEMSVHRRGQFLELASVAQRTIPCGVLKAKTHPGPLAGLGKNQIK